MRNSVHMSKVSKRCVVYELLATFVIENSDPFKQNGSHYYQFDVHFHFNGCCVVFYIFIQSKIDYSLSKQGRP